MIVKVPPVPPIIEPASRVRGLLRPLGVSASGMSIQQRIMDLISENIQNARTTRTTNGGPYRRKLAVLERDPAGTGVRVARIVEDPSPGQTEYQPGHPDADADGNVLYPNIDIITEITELMIARRMYEANATAFQTAKAMIRRALDI